ncbi:MAG: hypothetical protein PWR03_1003 [Tenuifilum sp.]|uniref:NAD-dependent epimerase/dehydratase family protein n=1 Tax=Tenuifilum sp. TaxID=2760880 RepID=UPI0024AB120E|nr:NAD-dependent epimerase/dehydratase family protein [Tenuifilum sp.]MDI3526820.1 hypothetical protein [Tenuifilum sp.]
MKVIITGSTGMVGKGVFLECLDDDKISEVLLINRTPIGINHPKIKEVIHKDFTNFLPLRDRLSGYDACFHCMGVSSAGMSHEQYYKLTYTVTESLANLLYELNPDMTFIYVSGEGTDGTEKGKSNWARVKGKTENLILNKGFKDAYAFRPGVILPEKGVVSKTRLYRIIYKLMYPFFPILKKLKSVTTSSKIGKAMIILVEKPYDAKIIRGQDINLLVSKYNF